ncbi:hypothetical protein PIB30_020644 [Stylosanthes scabra]|uniref:Uncharacterized protein n=1 Tax=Stylosanthes scabra TaxID=79078 RepID=A0ABU6UBV2_9FABA|nr:hypothetical protein [Stylosanthes scabra]
MVRSRETRGRVFGGGCFDKEEALVEEVLMRARSRKPTMYTWQVIELRSGKQVMSGTSASSSGSDVAGSTGSAGSVSATGHNVSGLAVTTAATVSTAVGSTRSTSENEQKQLHDEGWYPFGMPPNFQPQVVPSNPRGTVPTMVQFGSVSNEQPFSDMSRSAASGGTTQPLSTTVVRQLIEESHLDLLAKKFDTLVGFDDSEVHDLDIGVADQAHDAADTDGRFDQEVDNNHSTQGNIRIVRRGENADNVLHQVRAAN